jgi:hypothetical protein
MGTGFTILNFGVYGYPFTADCLPVPVERLRTTPPKMLQDSAGHYTETNLAALYLEYIKKAADAGHRRLHGFLRPLPAGI